MRECWGMAPCNGGLKWQIFTSETGHDYKNSISNGLYFRPGTRLAKLTSNPEYITEAERALEWWVQGVGLIDNNYNVYDRTDDIKGCTSVDHDQWSYNVGVYLYGNAVMQALINDPKWVTRTNDLLATTGTFFKNSVMAEKCEQAGTRNVSQLCFKAYLSR
jgi:mannan endo-1,6-alpha-mannosidase